MSNIKMIMGLLTALSFVTHGCLIENPNYKDDEDAGDTAGEM